MMMEVDEDWYEVADEFLSEHGEAQAKQAPNTPRRIRLSYNSHLPLSNPVASTRRSFRSLLTHYCSAFWRCEDGFDSAYLITT